MQLGPDYDLAVRLKRIEDQLSRMGQNQIGQLFSASQSDGSLGVTIGQRVTGDGSVVVEVFQGPNTPVDPETGRHPTLLYAGETFVGGAPSDSAFVLFRPDGSQALVAGAGGVGIMDPKGNVVFTTDQPAGEGLGKPYLSMPMPRPAVLSAWASTNATSWSLIAYSDPIMQQPKLLWSAYLLADAGTTGKARVNINNGAVIGPEHTITTTNTPVADLLTLPAGFYGQTWQVGIEAEVTGGTGSVHVQTVNMYGFAS